MITVYIHKGKDQVGYFEMNISHIREKNTTVAYWDVANEEVDAKLIKHKVFDQFGGYTIASYSLPKSMQLNKPNDHNRIVISRCSHKDNYDRHKGIMCCIEKIIQKLIPDKNHTIVPMLNDRGRLISEDKVININLV